MSKNKISSVTKETFDITKCKNYYADEVRDLLKELDPSITNIKKINWEDACNRIDKILKKKRKSKKTDSDSEEEKPKKVIKKVVKKIETESDEQSETESDEDSEETIKKSLYDEMKSNIIGYLEDDEMNWKKTKINEFVKENKKNIQKAVEKMYSQYKKDGELKDLKNREKDWVREYLFKYVKFPKNESSSSESEEEKPKKIIKKKIVKKIETESDEGTEEDDSCDDDDLLTLSLLELKKLAEKEGVSKTGTSKIAIIRRINDACKEKRIKPKKIKEQVEIDDVKSCKQKYSWNELKNMCRERGLPVTGTTDVLCKRLKVGVEEVESEEVKECIVDNTVQDLKRELRKEGKRVTGTKQDLCVRKVDEGTENERSEKEQSESEEEVKPKIIKKSSKKEPRKPTLELFREISLAGNTGEMLMIVDSKQFEPEIQSILNNTQQNIYRYIAELFVNLYTDQDQVELLNNIIKHLENEADIYRAMRNIFNADAKKENIMYAFNKQKDKLGDYYDQIKNLFLSDEKLVQFATNYITHLKSINKLLKEEECDQNITCNVELKRCAPSETTIKGVKVVGDKKTISEIDNEAKEINGLIIKPYSDKSILVSGNTSPYKEKLKEIGGKWNKPLKGWIFQKSKYNDVLSLIEFPDIEVEDSKFKGVKISSSFLELINEKSGIDIQPYTEKSFIVLGDTIQFKDKLKEIGGKYLLTKKGWIFSNSKRDQVDMLLKKKEFSLDETPQLERVKKEIPKEIFEEEILEETKEIPRENREPQKEESMMDQAHRLLQEKKKMKQQEDIERKKRIEKPTSVKINELVQIPEEEQNLKVLEELKPIQNQIRECLNL